MASEILFQLKVTYKNEPKQGVRNTRSIGRLNFDLFHFGIRTLIFIRKATDEKLFISCTLVETSISIQIFPILGLFVFFFVIDYLRTIETKLLQQNSHD